MEPRIPARSNVLAPSSEFRLEFRSYCLKGEDPDQLEQLAYDYLSQFNPQGTLENFLVQTLVLAEWNRHRWDRTETALLRGAEDPVLVFMDARAGRLMLKVQQRLETEQRRYMRAVNGLRRLQKLRKSAQK